MSEFEGLHNGFKVYVKGAYAPAFIGLDVVKPSGETTACNVPLEQAVAIGNALIEAAGGEDKGDGPDRITTLQEQVELLKQQVTSLQLQLSAEAEYGAEQTSLANAYRDVLQDALERRGA